MTANTIPEPTLPETEHLTDEAQRKHSRSRSAVSSSSAASSAIEVVTTSHGGSLDQKPTDASLNGAAPQSLASSDVPTALEKTLDHLPAGSSVQNGPSSKTTANPFPDSTEKDDGLLSSTEQREQSVGTPAPGTAGESEPLRTPQKDALQVNLAVKARLPHDKLGILEDRVKDDPRGDTEAWLSLVDEHKRRHKLDEARSTYERFFQVFPFAAEIWLSYAQMENEANNRHALDNVLGKSLMTVPYLPLWAFYLDHVRRHNNLTTDTSGTARQTIHQAYELALRQVGLDKDSGRLWQDYIAFVKSGPGIIGGSNWQDQQKMDQLRKTYQQAICIPTQATNLLWKEYDGFEMGLNKVTGRKFLQDQAPSYMSARSSYTELQNITRGLKRTTIPSLPPAQGCEGDVEFVEQLNIWKRWIQWEKEDPLALKQDDLDAYKSRVLFVYKHALMALRFWPDVWYEASEFCYDNSLNNEGEQFLVQGMAANPESCLLAFKRADRLETSSSGDEGEGKQTGRAEIVREPYEKVLTALYDLISKQKSREQLDIARIEEQYAAPPAGTPNAAKNDAREEDDDVQLDKDQELKAKQKAAQVEATKTMHASQIKLLSQTLSYVWVALMRAMRRIQGKGGVGAGGARGVFSDARKRGRITSDVYVQAALIEYHCYEPDTGRKIFERGLKLFQEDEQFALEYIKHLVANNDHTNARVVFETVVTRLASKPETVAKSKPLYAFFHDFESRYGELAQIIKLEKRMTDLFPEDPSLSIFSRRFVENGFSPTTFQPIISPAKQIKPKTGPNAMNTIPDASLTLQTNSPKRALPLDGSDDEDRPRKALRGASPFVPSGIPQPSAQYPPTAAPIPQPQPPPAQSAQITPTTRPPHAYLPPPLPREVTNLLSIIPRAEAYHATKFAPSEMVRLIRETNIPNNLTQLHQQQPAGNTQARMMQLPNQAPPPPQPQPQPQPPMQHMPQPYPQPAVRPGPGMPPAPPPSAMPIGGAYGGGYPAQYGYAR